MDAAFLAQLLLNGLVLGSIYALLAAGLSLIFGVLEVVNFAHGALYMFGALCAMLAIPIVGYVPAIVVAAVVLGLVGLVLYDGLIKRIPEDRTFSRSIILTIGVTMVLQNGAIMLFGARPRSVLIEGGFSYIEIGELRLPVIRIFVVGVAVASFVVLYLVLQHTRIGKAMRGISQNRQAALMVGIAPETVARVAIVLGVGLAGVAGAALAPVFSVHPLMGVGVVFKAFAIVIIGGMGSIPGAAIVAVSIGLTESFAGGLTSSVVQNGIVFAFMLAILFLRPQGLFGRRVRV